MALNFGLNEKGVTIVTEGGLSESGFTMAGDISMGGNKILNLPDPTSNSEPVTKSFADANYSGGGAGTRGPVGPKGPKGDEGPRGPQGRKGDDGAKGRQGEKGDEGSRGSRGEKGVQGTQGPRGLKGDKGDTGPKGAKGDASGLGSKGFHMQGDINMGTHKIVGLPTPAHDTEASTKKYCDDTFQRKGTAGSISGTVSSDINMNFHKILNLPTPTIDAEPVTKMFTEDTFLKTAGDIMTGNIDMDQHRILNLLKPKLGKEPVTKEYFTENYTKADWIWGYYSIRSTYRYPYRQSGWPAPVRTDEITNDTNLELRHITFDDELTEAQIKACTLYVTLIVKYIESGSATIHTHNPTIFTLPLNNKTVLNFNTYVGTNDNTFTLPLEEEYWFGTSTTSDQTVLGFSVKIKLSGVPAGKSPEVLCEFCLNENGKFG